MKKFISILMAILLFVGTISVSAANIGDIVNMTVYTDIVAKINGQDIASYNIDGYTVVIAEDLRQYGFDVIWNPDERALYITKSQSNPAVTSTYTSPKISASKVGKKAFDVLYSDIKTYMDGELVASHNINGRTVIYFNDLSRYGNVSYDNSIRTLSGQFPWLKGPAVWYSLSMYRVGSDIPAGDYYAVATDSRYSGYYCKYTDSSRDDIEDNDNFSNFTFFRCYEGQYLELSRCKITSIENAPVNSSENGVYGEGTYRVGIDLPAGEYKFTATDTKYSGYFCAYTDITYDDIEENDNFESVTYYTVENGQYLELSRCTAVCVKESTHSTPQDNTSSNGGEDYTSDDYDDNKFSFSDATNFNKYAAAATKACNDATSEALTAFKKPSMSSLYVSKALSYASIAKSNMQNVINLLENKVDLTYADGSTVLDNAIDALNAINDILNFDVENGDIIDLQTLCSKAAVKSLGIQKASVDLMGAFAN